VTGARPGFSSNRPHLKEASIMGKYILGWIMGVPVVVLVIIYLIFN